MMTIDNDNGIDRTMNNGQLLTTDCGLWTVDQVKPARRSPTRTLVTLARCRLIDSLTNDD